MHLISSNFNGMHSERVLVIVQFSLLALTVGALGVAQFLRKGLQRRKKPTHLGCNEMEPGLIDLRFNNFKVLQYINDLAQDFHRYPLLQNHATTLAFFTTS